MDFDASDPQLRAEARRAFWETLQESRAAYQAATGNALGAPKREDVEHQFKQWLASMGMRAFPFYPSEK